MESKILSTSLNSTPPTEVRATILAVAGHPVEVGPFLDLAYPRLASHFQVIAVPFGEAGYGPDVDLFVGERIIDRVAHGRQGDNLLFMASGISKIRQVRMMAHMLPDILGPGVVQQVAFVYMDSTNVEHLQKATDGWPLFYSDLTDESVDNIVRSISCS